MAYNKSMLLSGSQLTKWPKEATGSDSANGKKPCDKVRLYICVYFCSANCQVGLNKTFQPKINLFRLSHPLFGARSLHCSCLKLPTQTNLSPSLHPSLLSVLACPGRKEVMQMTDNL